jgi:hypothetical protein
MSKISGDLVPFMAFFSWAFGYDKKDKPDHHPGLPTSRDNEGGVARKWMNTDNDAKRRPRIAGGGENLPLDILCVLSDWVSVLEARGTVPGGDLGGISACIANFEQSLSSLEMILTTPLPFVYSAHIRHTVWVYLFFLPFQLVNEFRWSAIGGVGIAAFIYLGFLAAGEEIEQPFGYDTNDLDLDLFTGEIIHGDIGDLKKTPCFNAYHSYPSEKANHSISDTVEQIESKKHRYHAEIQDWDADGDGVGDGYGIGDDVFGIQVS